jgi:hypothetical protein
MQAVGPMAAKATTALAAAVVLDYPALEVMRLAQRLGRRAQMVALLVALATARIATLILDVVVAVPGLLMLTLPPMMVVTRFSAEVRAAGAALSRGGQHITAQALAAARI